MKKSIVLIFSILLAGCSYFNTQNADNQDVYARIGDNVLYKKDIRQILPKGYSLEDSISISANYVNSWALKKLLMIKAQENISKENKLSLEALVDEYRSDLYTQSYIEKLVSKNVDTIVSEKEIQEFYQSNKNIFRANEEFVKVRYIQITDSDFKDRKLVESFKRFNAEDKNKLMDKSSDFISFFFNDSVWTKANDFVEKNPFMNGKLKVDYFQNRDSTGVSTLVKITDIVRKDETTPLQYAQVLLKQIIINKRKLEYVKELEKDIINIAIKNKQFEIYD